MGGKNVLFEVTKGQLLSGKIHCMCFSIVQIRKSMQSCILLCFIYTANIYEYIKLILYIYKTFGI